MTVAERIASMGLYLPEPAKAPPGTVIDFAWVRLHGDRAFVSGHAAQAPDGTIVGPFGRVGAEVSPEQATEAARFAALAAIGSLKRAIGSLERVSAWLRVDGFVLAAPSFIGTTNVINGASRLIVDLFGAEIGQHARTAMGVSATPLSCCVVIAAEVALRI
jgi:enamine deaminase RidA (YjgF/YER057c/UK114 family)